MSSTTSRVRRFVVRGALVPCALVVLYFVASFAYTALHERDDLRGHAQLLTHLHPREAVLPAFLDSLPDLEFHCSAQHDELGQREKTH